MDEDRFNEILAVVMANVVYDIHRLNIELNYRQEVSMADVADYGGDGQLFGGADVTTGELDDFDAMLLSRYGVLGDDCPNLQRIREEMRKEREQEEARTRARNSALSKLSPEDCLALGLGKPSNAK